MKFLYSGNEKDGSNWNQAVLELKKSVKYLSQSMAGKDDIDSFLQRLGEYSDSIIVKSIDEGKEFLSGICILKINKDDAEIVDVTLSFKFQNENKELEEHQYTNHVSGQNFTDLALEKLREKNAMMFEITR